MATNPSEERLPLTIEHMEDFEIGKNSGGLYYKGLRVQTESVVVLSGKQSAIAIAVAIATILSALATVITTWKAVADPPKPPQVVVIPQTTTPSTVPTSPPASAPEAVAPPAEPETRPAPMPKPKSQKTHSTAGNAKPN